MSGEDKSGCFLVLIGHILVAFFSGKFSWEICPIEDFFSFLLFMFLWGALFSLSEFFYQVLLVWLLDGKG